jgi:hypothetical protein
VWADFLTRICDSVSTLKELVVTNAYIGFERGYPGPGSGSSPVTHTHQDTFWAQSSVTTELQQKWQHVEGESRPFAYVYHIETSGFMVPDCELNAAEWKRGDDMKAYRRLMRRITGHCGSCSSSLSTGVTA